MKLCTCPRIATARGLLPTGDIDARCPVHGPGSWASVKPVIPPRPRELAVEGTPRERMLHCEECGRDHAPDQGCDFADEN